LTTSFCTLTIPPKKDAFPKTALFCAVFIKVFGQAFFKKLAGLGGAQGLAFNLPYIFHDFNMF